MSKLISIKLIHSFDFYRIQIYFESYFELTLLFYLPTGLIFIYIIYVVLVFFGCSSYKRKRVT